MRKDGESDVRAQTSRQKREREESNLKARELFIHWMKKICLLKINSWDCVCFIALELGIVWSLPSDSLPDWEEVGRAGKNSEREREQSQPKKTPDLRSHTRKNNRPQGLTRPSSWWKVDEHSWCPRMSFGDLVRKRRLRFGKHSHLGHSLWGLELHRGRFEWLMLDLLESHQRRKFQCRWHAR